MEEAAKQLLGQGILGTVCVVLLFALQRVFKLYVDAQEKRIAEQGETKAVVERNAAAMTALTEVIKSRRG